MKDLHRRNMFQVLGNMYDFNCPCCNWTKHGNTKKNKRIVNKQIRARLKQKMINIED